MLSPTGRQRCHCDTKTYMTTTTKLTELFRAIAAGDVDAAADVASQLVKAEEKKGHTTVARMLRGALSGGAVLSEGLEANHRTVAALPVSSGVVRLQSDKTLSQVVLAKSVRAKFDDLISEWEHRDFLMGRGLPRRSKLLFHGPPGCGKSMTAKALGAELGLPVFMVRFDAVIGSFLGQTAMHLRQLFLFAESTPCVLLLDELDALGKKRGNPLDVGELDRIVISLMQELEHSRPKGIVIGTTNLPRHLDDALWRRFDIDVHFDAPNEGALRAFALKIAKERGATLARSVVQRATKERSFAGAERVVLDEIRRQALAQIKRK
jgi:SpoVK/Ycf46/Vps4 family AAA+-type ATPase